MDFISWGEVAKVSVLLMVASLAWYTGTNQKDK